jgi:hypothetical protein
MRKFVILVAVSLAAAIGVVSLAQGAGKAPEIRKITSAVSTGRGTPKANRPAGLKFTLATTRPFGAGGVGTCSSFGSDCTLPNVAIHEDIVLPSGFRFNGGILDGNAAGNPQGNPLFSICRGADTAPRNGIPDLIERPGGPGNRCKTIGGGKGAAVGYLHTCRSNPAGIDQNATLDQQAAVGRKVTADIAVYNGGGKAGGNGGIMYARVVLYNAQTQIKIVESVLKVSFIKNKISFDMPDNLVEPVGSCAPFTSIVLSLSLKGGRVQRSTRSGRLALITRGLIETGACKTRAKTWAFSNTVRLSSGAVDSGTGKIIRSLNNPNVQTTSGNTTARCAS